MPIPTELRIVQYDGDKEVYLFYCDDAGRQMSDTLHDTVEEAMKQGEWEFAVRPDEWESMP
jgi:hypothetical protein